MEKRSRKNDIPSDVKRNQEQALSLQQVKKNICFASFIRHQKPSPFVKPDFPRYARLLALRQESSELIHHITIPVITSAAKAMRTLDEKSREALSIDFLATDIQAYCRHSDRYRYSNEDYYHSPEILK